MEETKFLEKLREERKKDLERMKEATKRDLIIPKICLREVQANIILHLKKFHPRIERERKVESTIITGAEKNR